MSILNEEVAAGASPPLDGKGGRERGHGGLPRRRAWRNTDLAYGRVGRRNNVRGWTVNEISSTPGSLAGVGLDSCGQDLHVHRFKCPTCGRIGGARRLPRAVSVERRHGELQQRAGRELPAVHHVLERLHREPAAAATRCPAAPASHNHQTTDVATALFHGCRLHELQGSRVLLARSIVRGGT
jgi:hypothetical protein